MKTSPIKDECLVGTLKSADGAPLSTKAKQLTKQNDNTTVHSFRQRITRKTEHGSSQSTRARTLSRVQVRRDGLEVSSSYKRKVILTRPDAKPAQSKQTNKYANTNTNERQPSRGRVRTISTSRLNTQRSIAIPTQISPTPSQSPQLSSDDGEDDTSSNATVHAPRLVTQNSLGEPSEGDSTAWANTLASASPKREEALRSRTHVLTNQTIQEITTGFVQNLPIEWILPILRAATLQVVTEQFPTSLISSSMIFEAYSEAKGELAHVLTRANLPAGSPIEQLGKLISGRQPPPSGDAAKPPSQSSNTIFAYSNAANSTVDLNNFSPPESTGLVDLVGMMLAIPAILRFRIHYVRHIRIQEFITRSEQQAKTDQKGKKNVQTRETAAMHLFLDEESDIRFGAHLCQGASRLVQRGSRFLFPYQSGESPADAEENLIPTTCWAAVSFVNMPSIFLKALEDRKERFAHQANSEASSQLRGKHYRVRPFFAHEFATTLACGSDGGCIFASALTCEFFVGMPSFISQPMNCIAPAIRATLHRMCLAITKEMLRQYRGSVVDQPHSLRAPPLDLALLYIRGPHVYYASTTGIQGKLILLNADVQGRLCVDIYKDCFPASLGGISFAATKISEAGPSNFCKDKGPPKENGDIASPHGRKRESRRNLTLLAGGYDMPTIVRGFVDLSSFADSTAATSVNSPEPTPGPNQVLKAAALHPSPSTTTARKNLQSRMVFPFSVVLACTEFWSVIPIPYAADLLRALILLDHEAMTTIKVLNLEQIFDRQATTSGQPSVPEPRQSFERRNLEHAMVVENRRRVIEFLKGLDSIFSPDVRTRITSFYEARLSYYIHTCRLITLDPLQLYTEELQARAEARMKGKAWNPDSMRLFSDVGATPLHSNRTRSQPTELGPYSGREGRVQKNAIDNPKQGKCRGPSMGNYSRQDCADPSTKIQPLCDVLAAFLVAEASILSTAGPPKATADPCFTRRRTASSERAAQPTSASFINGVGVPTLGANVANSPLERLNSTNYGQALSSKQEEPDPKKTPTTHTLTNRFMPREGMENTQLCEPFSVAIVLLPKDISFSDASRHSRSLEAIHHARRNYSNKP